MLKKNVYWNLWRSKIRAFLKTKDIYPAKMSTHRSAITQLVDVQFSTFFFGRQHIVTSSVFTKRDDELALVLNQVSHNSVALWFENVTTWKTKPKEIHFNAATRLVFFEFLLCTSKVTGIIYDETRLVFMMMTKPFFQLFSLSSMCVLCTVYIGFVPLRLHQFHYFSYLCVYCVRELGWHTKDDQERKCNCVFLWLRLNK